MHGQLFEQRIDDTFSRKTKSTILNPGSIDLAETAINLKQRSYSDACIRWVPRGKTYAIQRRQGAFNIWRIRSLTVSPRTLF